MAKRMAIALCAAFLCAACGDSSGGARGTGGVDPLAPMLEVRGMAELDAFCVPSTEVDSALVEGTWDLASLRSYAIALVLENVSLSRPSENVDLNDISVVNVQVALQEPDGTLLDLGPQLFSEYSVPATVVVPVSQGDQPSLGAFITAAVPDAYIDALSMLPPQAYVAEFVVVGSSPGGVTVRSSPFSWTIRICENCLARQCSELEAAEIGCLAGQDGMSWCLP